MEAIVSPPEFSKTAGSMNLRTSLRRRVSVVRTENVGPRKIFRLLEIFVAILLAFLTLAVVSFLMIRPTLKEVRMEARAEWAALARAIPERNSMLPAVVESFKGFEPGHNRMAERLAQARSICMRSSDPDRIVAANDEIDRSLEEIRRIAVTKPALAQYPPFATQWKKIEKISLRIVRQRAQYNNTAISYNRLLGVFPQNLLAAASGFTPLNVYPIASGPDIIQ